MRETDHLEEYELLMGVGTPPMPPDISEDTATPLDDDPLAYDGVAREEAH